MQTEGPAFNRIHGLVKDRFEQYCAFKNIDYSLPVFKSFEPIDILEFDDLEECFDIGITVLEMNLDTRELIYIRESDSRSENKLHILDYNGHAMYIPRIDALSSKYPCDRCEMIFGTWEKLAGHKKTQCQTLTRELFCNKPRNYRPAENRFKILLNKYTIKDVDHYMDHFIVYDFEAMLSDKFEQRGESTKYINEHVPISVSVCDSLSGGVRCFISDDPKNLLEQMFNYIDSISDDIYEYNNFKYSKLYDAINEAGNTKGSLKSGRQLNEDYDKLHDICQQTSLLGFNSGRYDINLIKKELFTVLGPESLKRVIKNPSYMCILTVRCKMLDIKNYLPPATSSSSHLKTYTGGCQCKDKIRCVCGLGKGIFPYEYINKFERLSETTIPPIRAFDSDLHNTQISKEDYERVKFVWKHYGMKSVSDLLIWYNNLDVKPFVTAVQKQRELYKKFGLDMFADGVSLPSLAEKIMYQTLYKKLDPINRRWGEAFSFPKERFAGYRKQGADAERGFNMTLNHVNVILIEQRFSCKHCGCGLSEENASVDRIDNTKGHIDGNIVISCILCNVARKDMSINRFSYMKRIEANADKLVWSIDADNKDIFHKMKANIAGGPSIIFNRYAKRNETTIRGGKLVKKIIGYDANALYLWALGSEMPCGQLKTIETYEGIVDDIKNDKLFGFLECDIETPEHLKDYFRR